MNVGVNEMASKQTSQRTAVADGLQSFSSGGIVRCIDMKAKAGEIRRRIELGRHIVADSKICGGQPTFKGTRIMVWIVLEQLDRGLTWREILQEWDGRVSEEAISEAIAIADVVVKHEPFRGSMLVLDENLPAAQRSGFIAYRFYAPLLFSNASHFVQRVRGLLAASPVPVRWFLVDAQAITDIDITAAEALRALNQELHQQGIALKFAHTNRPLRKVLERIGFTSEIGRESIFHAVHEAADAFQKS